MDRCAQLVLHPPRNVQPVQLVVQEIPESAVVLPRATAFRTRWSLSAVDVDAPARRALQQSTRDVTKARTNVAAYGPITIAIRARFDYDSTTIRLQHATTRYEVFRALAYEIDSRTPRESVVGVSCMLIDSSMHTIFTSAPRPPL